MDQFHPAQQAALQCLKALGPGEFYANGDKFELVFSPGPTSLLNAHIVVGKFACGDTAYWLPGLVAALLNRALLELANKEASDA